MEDFIDMEGDVQPAKGTTDLPKRKTKKVETPVFNELETKVISMYPQFNENQIAAMLMIPKRQVIEILNK